MYVCICHEYTDTEIREAVAITGKVTVQDIYWALGAGPCCRSCVDFAQEIIDGVTHHVPTGHK